MSRKKTLLAISSPSGGGKSTVARYLLNKYDNLKFSVSATTRKPRANEIDGKDYFFLSKEEFLRKISEGDLIEYEEIFGNYYGTLKSEVEKAKSSNHCLLFDIDVKGALSIKRIYPEDSLLIFISPPNLDILKERLIKRGSETEEQLNIRLARAKMEMGLREQFDFDLMNDDLNNTLKQADKIVTKYMRV
ncbi:guanylate kinase [Bacteroidetes/Chlorobi group bacterium ChocPot_Mid]|jgi:guanylate kinase|nr:MAG: guanylate kinase [Bacteroidetes/Chlorobi group bacterium ChocPot_Mid]